MKYYGCTCDPKSPPRERCSKDVARCQSRANIFLEEAKANKTGPFKEKPCEACPLSEAERYKLLAGDIVDKTICPKCMKSRKYIVEVLWPRFLKERAR